MHAAHIYLHVLDSLMTILRRYYIKFLLKIHVENQVCLNFAANRKWKGQQPSVARKLFPSTPPGGQNVAAPSAGMFSNVTGPISGMFSSTMMSSMQQMTSSPPAGSSTVQHHNNDSGG